MPTLVAMRLEMLAAAFKKWQDGKHLCEFSSARLKGVGAAPLHHFKRV